MLLKACSSRLIEICRQRRAIEQRNQTVRQAFTFGKRLAASGEPNKEEMDEIFAKFPQYSRKPMPLQKPEASVRGKVHQRKSGSRKLLG